MEEEIGQGMTVESISYMVSSMQSNHNNAYDIDIYMGLTELDVLTDIFQDNYTPGTKQLVLSADSICYGDTVDAWSAIQLQYPFHYEGQGNLVIEIVCPNSGYSPVYNWNTGSNRVLYTYNLSSSTGTRYSHLPYMLLSGSLGLEQRTFGSIKVLLGSE